MREIDLMLTGGEFVLEGNLKKAGGTLLIGEMTLGIGYVLTGSFPFRKLLVSISLIGRVIISILRNVES